MHKNQIKYLLILLLLPAFWACEAEIDQATPDAGEIDLTTFVAIGNSLTAGFKDGELFRSGQEHSLANIMAGQFMHAGLSSFRQPYMKDDLGFGNRLVLADTEGGPMPVPAPGTPDAGNFQNIFQSEGPFHNMGVPGSKAGHLLFEGYGTLYPYFGRFASNPQTSSVLSDAMALHPTFFTLWTGNNDVLLYAISGGEGDGITPVIEFEMAYQAIVAQLTAAGAKGAVANIPDISSIPFFTTVPYNALPLLDPAVITLLNTAYEAAPHISFSTGLNPLVVVDPGHPAGIRQLEQGELVLITALNGIQNQGWGSQEPLAAEYYLSLEQIEDIKEASEQYNSVIKDVAESYGLAFVDIEALLKRARTGLYYDAIPFDTQFISGGVFSLDGIHLSVRASAVVANEFIDAINHKYHASVPRVAIGNFPGIVFP